jgi:hypothetical protein
MTPATGGEVDELLEARLVVAGTHHARHRSAKGCLASRAALPPSDREDHGATPQPPPTQNASLTVRARARVCVVARRPQGQAPPGWPTASLDPGHADNARPPTDPSHPPPARPPDPLLDTAPPLQGCRSRAPASCIEDRAGKGSPQRAIGRAAESAGVSSVTCDEGAPEDRRRPNLAPGAWRSTDATSPVPRASYSLVAPSMKVVLWTQLASPRWAMSVDLLRVVTDRPWAILGKPGTTS